MQAVMCAYTNHRADAFNFVREYESSIKEKMIFELSLKG
jgi:hypothetical protein